MANRKERRMAAAGKATTVTSTQPLDNIGKAPRYNPDAYDNIYESKLDILYNNANSIDPMLDMDSFDYAQNLYNTEEARYLDYRKDRASKMTERIDNAIDKRIKKLEETVPKGDALNEAISYDEALQRAYSSRSAWERYGKSERGSFSDFKDIKKTAKAAGSEAAESAAKAAGEGAAEAAKTAGKEAAEKVAKKSAEGLWDLAKKNKVPQIALGVAATAWLVNKLSDSRGQQSNAQLYGQQGY